MINLSKDNLLSIKLDEENGLYLSCSTDTTHPSLTLSKTPYLWEVRGNQNNPDMFSGSILTHIEGSPSLFVQVNSLSLKPGKDYFDAILSEKNKYALRIIQPHSSTTSSVFIYLVDGNTSREYCLGTSKNSLAIVFSHNETTWQLEEFK